MAGSCSGSYHITYSTTLTSVPSLPAGLLTIRATDGEFTVVSTNNGDAGTYTVTISGSLDSTSSTDTNSFDLIVINSCSVA